MIVSLVSCSFALISLNPYPPFFFAAVTVQSILAGLHDNRWLGFFRRPAQPWATDVDALSIAVADVITVAVNRVYMNRFRVETVAKPEPFNRFFQGHRFFEVIPERFSM